MVALISLMEGAAALGAGVLAGAAIADMHAFLMPEVKSVKGLTPWVAIAVTADTVEVWTADRRHRLGFHIATYRKGEFRGHTHRYPERVDLTPDNEANGRLVLSGIWALHDEECLNTARAAAALASGPAH